MLGLFRSLLACALVLFPLCASALSPLSRPELLRLQEVLKFQPDQTTLGESHWAAVIRILRSSALQCGYRWEGRTLLVLDSFGGNGTLASEITEPRGVRSLEIKAQLEVYGVASENIHRRFFERSRHKSTGDAPEEQEHLVVRSCCSPTGNDARSLECLAKPTE